MGLVVREAGKSLANAVAEIREAIDFLRYYSTQIRNEFSNDTHRPLGPVVCISPWNFPLAIFMGQVAAALAAGNTVLAKPAEQTPLIAAQAVRILREAGVPAGAVQLLPGNGETVGAALVADPRTRAVMFTGSTEVARLINKTLSEPPRSGRQTDSADRRNRRPECDDRRFVGAGRASGRGRVAVVVRFRRSTLFGAARAVPAGRCRGPHARNADGRDARTAGGQSGPPVDRRRPGDRRRSEARHRRAHRGDARERPQGRSNCRCRKAARKARSCRRR